MTSLTEVAQSTRKIVKAGAFLTAGFIVFRVGSSMFISYWKAAHPPKAPPPGMQFGKIPKITLTDIKHNEGQRYKLETPTNTLPVLPDRANIYYSPYSKPSLLALEKAKKQVLMLGFTAGEKKMTDKVYQWEDIGKNSKIEMNIYNGTFEYEYDWRKDIELIQSKLTLNEAQAVAKAKQVLAQSAVWTADMSEKVAKTQYLQISGQKLIPAVSQSEANFIKVNFYRNDVDTFPVKTLINDQGIVQVIISSSPSVPNGIITIINKYFPIDYETSSDYPLKNSASLWNQFISNAGYIISPSTADQQEIVIRRIYLGYLDTLAEQKFFQPVIFFEGDNDFVGFIPALMDEVFE